MSANASNAEAIRNRLHGADDLLSRVAAALWARVGRVVRETELEWVRPILGPDGPQILYRALGEMEAMSGAQPTLHAAGVVRLINHIGGWDRESNSQTECLSDVSMIRLTWTLPARHMGHSSRGSSYRAALTDMISGAQQSLILLSPYLDPAGLGTIESLLVDALRRNVAVRIVTHDALDLSSLTSRALEPLRREAERLGGDLAVYSAQTTVGRDRLQYPLLHAKIVIEDNARVLLGSANITSYALSSNLECGVLLTGPPAIECAEMIQGIIDAGYVYLVFRTQRCREQ